MIAPVQIVMLLVGALGVGTMVVVCVLVRRAMQRRTREYNVLTHVGQAISSRLNPDDMLGIVHQELGKLFDVDTFYVAFQEDDEIRFEFHTEGGKLQPKHSRKSANAATEYVIRTGKPLLVRSEMERFKARTGLVSVGTPARCYCAAPVMIGGKPAGVIAAMNREREFVYDERDLELLETAAGQLSVAIENARLFSREQRRAHYLEFLNAVSRRAISADNAELMLAEIVTEIQKQFHFDHIGIGVVDYATNEIVIKAEASATACSARRRLPLSEGIVGMVARTGETALMQDANLAGHLPSVLPDAKSVLCIPLTYGETLLGVLNVESWRENAFATQDVLALKTLADLLATALHNVFVFQKMQHQSITDGLTGVKTRRYFLEALQAEWNRASRSGRPFSIVMVDLDRFKEVNDTLGHLEGDLVLARVGRVLEQKLRQSNVVARYGGDEFVILLPETGSEQAELLSGRLQVWLSTDPMLQERRITGSFGIATYPLHGATPEQVLRVADAGIYVSKHAGGNRVSVAEEVEEPEEQVVQRQLLAAYIEGFMQREQTGPESVTELVATLTKLCAVREHPKSLRDAITALCHAEETREIHSAGHGEFTARHAAALAREFGFGDEEIADLVYAARVHDVGKIVIPERVLCKAGPLSADDHALLRIHSTVSGQIVATIPDGANITAMVRHHHEHYDGAGYPDKLAGEQIPFGARIISVADAYVEMTTERPYAPAMTPAEALAQLQARSGKQFDAKVVDCFHRIITVQEKAIAD